MLVTLLLQMPEVPGSSARGIIAREVLEVVGVRENVGVGARIEEIMQEKGC